MNLQATARKNIPLLPPPLCPRPVIRYIRKAEAITLLALSVIFPATAHAIIDLGTLGGTNSEAMAVTNGGVVVGTADTSGGTGSAFRWTLGGGMTNLGTLGGTNSVAYSVSTDGSIVVGYSSTAAGAERAFRWTQSGGMVSLGTLGSADSYAHGISADSSVVVGYANTGGIGSAYHAFRWTQVGGMVDIGTLGGTNSFAYGVSADGNVVVGKWGTHAFRWTQGDGMVDLGTLAGGTFSTAYSTSADGGVVVGNADISGGASRAFRWTQITGMQTVDDWLTAGGVTITPGLTTKYGNSVSADGTIVVGRLTNGHAFLARVSPLGSGIIEPTNFNRTLHGSAYAHVQAVGQSDIVLNGLHATGAATLLKAGSRGIWIGGDWGRQDRVSGDGNIGAGEIGFSYGLSDSITAKIALGRTYLNQDILYGGNITMRGTYVVPD